MGKIRILTEDTISKIAAGEVVERPASVVKELVENSIDAGSDSIEIAVEGAGQSLIRVADNGGGMTVDDAEASCLRHATSKIEKIEDLDRIRTLGFRGEALASIAAVSQMDITSGTGMDEGIYIYLESGQIQKKRPAGRGRGTTVEVRNLFYNVPARRKFLKKEATELAEIINVVSRFILARPGIEFKLTHGDRRVLHATKEMGIRERASLVLGGELSRGMIEVSAETGGGAVSGFVSRPSVTRKDRRAQMFFVNGRYVRSRVLNDALYSAYRSLLERGTFPAAVLFIDMPPGETDVNVHPSKMEVKFEDEKGVKERLVTAIKNGFDRVKTEAAGSERVSTRKEMSAGDEPPGTPVFTGMPEVQAEFSYEAGEKAFFRPQESSDAGKGLYQTGLCYIVRLNADRITITDQHAAHERVLYEIFRKAREKGPVEVQNLLFPVNLELSAKEASVMEKTADSFRELGFQIEPFGQRTFAVQAVPAVIKDRDVQTVIREVLDDLSGKDLGKISVIDELVKLTACKAAIKAGDPLSVGEMESLLSQLARCDLPFTCPHGRPTTIDITVGDLEKLFRRK